MSYQRLSVTCFNHTVNHFTVPRYGTYRMQHAMRLTFLGARLFGDCGACRIALTVTFSPTPCPYCTHCHLLPYPMSVLHSLSPSPLPHVRQ